jgi:hypothetical protein
LAPAGSLPPDLRRLEFLAEAAELSARGGDVRRHVLGQPAAGTRLTPPSGN